MAIMLDHRSTAVFIYHEALAKQGDNAMVASVRPFACMSALSLLNRLTFDLDFLYGSRP